MATTLASLLGRVRVLLVDAGSTAWTDALLTEGIRLALGEYNLAGLTAVTISGLDGAVVSSLDGRHDSVIALGAAGYAGVARAVDQLDALPGGLNQSDGFREWAGARLADFRGMLGFIYPGYLTGSGDAGKIAAEIALMAAQTATLNGVEARAIAAAARDTAERAAAAARQADLRAGAAPWGTLTDTDGIGYGTGYDRR